LKKGKKRGVMGSLAMRVFAIGFVFLVLPMIFYSLFVYNREFENQTFNTYKELAIIEEDIHRYFKELEQYDLAYINLIHELVALIRTKGPLTDNKVTDILREDSKRRDVDAMIYCKNLGQNSLVCTSSTVKGYLNQEFTTLFKPILAHNDEGMIISKDRVFGYALYILKAFKKPNSNVLEGVIVEVISLKGLAEKLSELQHIFKVNVTIMNTNFDVLSGTIPALFGKEFKVVKRSDRKNYDLMGDKNELPLFESLIYDGGFHYFLDNIRRMGLFSKISHLNNYLLISISEDIVLKKVLNHILFLGVFLLFIVVVGSLLSIIVSVRVSRPLKRLAAMFEGVGHGDLDQIYSDDRFGFEINYLGQNFNGMLESLKAHIKQVQKERAQKEAYVRELEIGRQIQHSIFPQESMQIEGIDTAFYFLGAQEVAGDFYDWQTRGSKTIITIADGVGKGVLGCLYSLDLRSILRSMAYQSHDLMQIVTSTNTLFCDDTKDTGNFVTAFVAEYDQESHIVSFINCGHNPPMHLSKEGRVQELHTKGIAFGVDEGFEYEKGQVELKEGELILFFTDGVNETMNEGGELFTTRRLIETLEGLGEMGASQILEAINRELELFQGTAPQHDDKTMILFKHSK
jgi:phosphoserine phosphatase RsbU/P